MTFFKLDQTKINHIKNINWLSECQMLWLILVLAVFLQSSA